MAPDPATGKSRGSRYRTNDSQYRSGEGSERDSQRSEMGAKGKGEKESAATDSGRGVKRRQHAGGDGGVLGATSVAAAASHRSSKRWRADGSETSDVPADRWDGGASDPVKESTSSLVKGKQELDAKVEDGSSGKNTDPPGKEGMNTEKVVRKQRMSRASLVSDNRAITVMDLQETDVSIIDSNIRIKNKVSYRREVVTEATDSEVEKSVKDNVKSTTEVRSRRRWDRDGLKDGVDEVEDGPARGIVVTEGTLERDKRKEKSIGRERDSGSMRVLNGRSRSELVTEVVGRSEVSEENDLRTNEWKIQEDLRNVELEKELENRIRRRREESGDRDRWRDEDRERDAKRHTDPREDRTRDDRHREDYSRRERERHSDKHESRQHREGSRLSEGKLRDDRHYECDREHRSHREERQYRGRSNDLDDQGRGDRPRDQDHRERKSRDMVLNYDTDRRVRDKGYKEDGSDRERPYSSSVYGESVEGRNEHRPKRAREGDAGEGFSLERDQSRQAGRAGEPDTVGASDYSHEDKSRRSRDERDADCRLERGRGSPRDSGSTRAKARGNQWRNNDHTCDLPTEGQPSPPQDTRASPSSNRVDYSSPPRPDDRRSPRYFSQRTPSPPHLDVTPGPSRGKGAHGDWFERSNSVSSSSGTQRRPSGAASHKSDRRDRMKWPSSAEEEVKSGMHRSSRSMDEVRDGSLSPHRLRDQHMLGGPVKAPLHSQDSVSRGAMIGRADRERWRGSALGGSTSYDGVQLDHHIPDDLSPRDRNDRGRRMPMNRPPGSPMLRPQLATITVPPLAPLPPPPPFRPGIDNPAVLGPPNGGFDDGSCSRDQGRVDRKGVPLRREGGGAGMSHGDAWRGVNMGNWNSRNQGPMPGNAFPPFPPQFAPHSSSAGGGFPGLGQQFPVPPIFPGGGGRPPMDMGFGGRFMGLGGHMGETGDGFRGAGWHGHGEGDDGRGPPLMGPVDGWDGPGPHGDDRHRHGRLDWERGGPMGARVWERDRERHWEGRVRECASDFMPLRSQIEAPLQNSAFPPGGSGWGMPREPQGLSDLKHAPERPPYDIQESKRKPDGVPQKMKSAKSGGKPHVVSEGKRNKHATAAMQSVLSQLHISPELAGPDLYDKYRALLPVLDSDEQLQVVQDEDVVSDSSDEDLSLEVDSVGESLISAPKLLPKLLPPLPNCVFEAALEIYRKAGRGNKLQQSTVGSFVMPFDPADIKLPSIKMELRSEPVVSQQHDYADAPVVAQQEADVPEAGKKGNPAVAGCSRGMDKVIENKGGSLGLDACFKLPDNEVTDTDYGQVNVDVPSVPQERELAEYGDKNGDGAVAERCKVSESVGAKFEDREGDAIGEEFLPPHVEVAEYSDREFEADMEETLEEVPLGVAGGEQSRQSSEPAEGEEGEQENSLADVSNCHNSVFMDVEEVQLGNADAEEINDGSNVCTKAEERLQGDTGGRVFASAVNADSETDKILGAYSFGDESPIERNATDLQLGNVVEGRNVNLPETEEDQGTDLQLGNVVEAKDDNLPEAEENQQADLQLGNAVVSRDDNLSEAEENQRPDLQLGNVVEGRDDYLPEEEENQRPDLRLENIVEGRDDNLPEAEENQRADLQLGSVIVIRYDNLSEAEENQRADLQLGNVVECRDNNLPEAEENQRADLQLGNVVEGRDDNLPEAEENQEENAGVNEEDVKPGLKNRQQGEVSWGTRVEGSATSGTEVVLLGDAATVVTCEMDLEGTSDVADEGETVLKQPQVTLDELYGPSAEVESSRHVEEATGSAVQEDEVYLRTVSLEYVNILVEGDEVVVDRGDNLPAKVDTVLIEDKQVVGEDKKVESEVVLSTEPIVEVRIVEEACDGQSADRMGTERLLEASVSDDIKEASGDCSVYQEDVDNLHTPVVEMLERKLEASEVMVDTSGGDCTYIEQAADEVRLSQDGEDEISDPPDDMQLSGNLQATNMTQEFPAVVVMEHELNEESNGKLKEVEEENSLPQEQEPPVPVVEVQEPHQRQLRKRRASSRLLANAEVQAQQEAAQGQGSVGTRGRGGGKGSGKRAAKGTTRTSQRRSKRRGSTR